MFRLKLLLILSLYFQPIQSNPLIDFYINDFRMKIFNDSLDLTPACRSFYSYLNFTDRNYTEIFFKLFDASTKIPGGLAAGNVFDLGNFDECYYLVKAWKNQTIHGKYCVSTIPLSKIPFDLITRQRPLEQMSPSPRMLGNDRDSAGIHFAYCTPSVCSARDVQTILAVLEPIVELEFKEKYCYSLDGEPKLTIGAVTTICILCGFATLVFTSSFYEIILFYTNKKASHNLLLAFSALSNGKKIFQSSYSPDQLLCLNGIKALTMMWIIVAHEHSLLSMGAVQNHDVVRNFVKQKESMWILNSPLAVDTFFTIGGLVTMYTFLKSCDRGVKFNIIQFYLHRYLRLTPVFAIVILMHATLLEYLGNGPFWNNVRSVLAQDCKEYWWTGLLYIQNFVNAQYACVPQSWYLSIDMQLFFLSPLVLLPVKLWPKSTNYLLGLLIILGVAIPFTISYTNYLPAFMTNISEDTLYKYIKYYYMQPYSRFGPYVIGLLFGSIIYKAKKHSTKDINRKSLLTILTVLLLWFLALTGLVSCVYAGADLIIKDYDRLEHSLFNAFARSAWSLSLCLIVVLCVRGYGGPVDGFLSLPVFQFITKLSYTIYLIHYMVLIMRYASLRTQTHVSTFILFHQFWGDFMLSIALSLIFCLTFESPVIVLEKYFMHQGTKGTAVKDHQGSAHNNLQGVKTQECT